MEQVTWKLDSLDSTGGHAAAKTGSPVLSLAGGLSSIAFDGVGDAILVEANPLEGASTFTLEALFRPASRGMAEQRLVHIQSGSSPDRVLLETRLGPGGGWYADTFIASAGRETFLNDPGLVHSLDGWHTLALVFDGRQMRQYVDGVHELSAEIAAFAPLPVGRTCLGARINRIWWFKGAIAVVRFSRGALEEEQLLRPEAGRA